MDICGKLLSLVEVLNNDDDGIKMNQKLRHIISALSQECDTVKYLREFISQITSRSLEDSKFAIKVATLTSSHNFNGLEMFSQRVVALFLRELQKVYDNVFEKKDFDEYKFYNYVSLLGEFYNRARLSNGKPVDSLGLPIINCLQLLLKLNNTKSAGCLCSQLHTIGSMLYSSFPNDIKALMIKVRMTLLECKDFQLQAYYLLAIDLVNHKFVLDTFIGKFYTDVIEDGDLDIKHSNSNNINIVPPITVEASSCQVESKTVTEYNVNETKKVTEYNETTNELVDQRILHRKDLNTIEDSRPSKEATKKFNVHKNEGALKDNKKSTPSTKPSINDRLKFYRNKHLSETEKSSKEEIKNSQRNVITKTDPDNKITTNSVFSDALSQILSNLDVSVDVTPNAQNRKGFVQKLIVPDLNKAEEDSEPQYHPGLNISEKSKSVNGNSNSGASGGSNKKTEQIQRVPISERLKIHGNSNEANTSKREVNDKEKNISGSSANRKRDKEFDNSQKKVNNPISNRLKIERDSNADSFRSKNNSREDLKITSTPLASKLRNNLTVDSDNGSTNDTENNVTSVISPISDASRNNSTRENSKAENSSTGNLLGSRSHKKSACNNNSTKYIGRGRGGRFLIANAIASVGVKPNVSTRNTTTEDTGSNCSTSSNASESRPKAVSSIRSGGRGKRN